MGWAVTLTYSMRRRACAMMKKTHTVPTVSVGTVQQSAAQMTPRWLWRKVRQRCEGDAALDEAQFREQDQRPTGFKWGAD